MDMRRRRPRFSRLSVGLLQNLRHEARPQAILDYYATRGIKQPKKDWRGKFLNKEQYMKVITYS